MNAAQMTQSSSSSATSYYGGIPMRGPSGPLVQHGGGGQQPPPYNGGPHAHEPYASAPQGEYWHIFM
jgi:hypothetical protein